MSAGTATKLQGTDCVSDYVIDQLLADELEPAIAEGARAHLSSCLACRRRHREIEDELHAFDAPPLVAAARPRTGRRWWLAAGGAVAAAAVVLLVFGRGEQVAPQPEAVRSKGALALAVVLERAGQQMIALPGDPAQPGDRVQLLYSTPAAGYLVVLGRDGSGAVGRYFPDGPTAAWVPAGREQPVASSIVLDEVLGTEALHAVLCDHPVVVAPMVDSLRASAAIDAPQGCRTATFTLEKISP